MSFWPKQPNKQPQRSRKGMHYNRASAGSGRGISASQYNGLLDMHKDLYSTNAGQSPVPSALQNSVVANAVLGENAAQDVPPYSPVLIRKQVSMVNPELNAPSYEVFRPAEADTGLITDDHAMSYGMTMSEGVSAEKGGRIVIAGLAYVSVSQGDMRYTTDPDVPGSTLQRYGSFDSMFYCVQDGSLQPTPSENNSGPIGPVGHFKLVAAYDPDQLSAEVPNEDDEVLVLVDLTPVPQIFTVETTEVSFAYDPDAIEQVPGIIGKVQYIDNNTTSRVPSPSFQIVDGTNQDYFFEVNVFNLVGPERMPGRHQVEYSVQFNAFVFTGIGQTTLIGKADAAITAGSTGTISIWKAGVDTTENITGVKLDWMHGSTNVSLGKEVMITYFTDELVWRITGAECE